MHKWVCVCGVFGYETVCTCINVMGFILGLLLQVCVGLFMGVVLEETNNEPDSMQAVCNLPC